MWGGDDVQRGVVVAVAHGREGVGDQHDPVLTSPGCRFAAPVGDGAADEEGVDAARLEKAMQVAVSGEEGAVERPSGAPRIVGGHA